MALDIATNPDTSGLLPRLGLTDEHPLGWLTMSPSLREAEHRGLCMILGRPRPDGRCFVVAKTEAGARRWVEFASECAERWEAFPVLDSPPEHVILGNDPLSRRHREDIFRREDPRGYQRLQDAIARSAN
jgi:hypothetical protein